MHSTFFIVASLALLAFCLCESPANAKPTPSATGKDDAVSGASGKAAGGFEHPRARRAVDGQESDLLPSSDDVDVSPFGEVSQFEGRGRIKVLPAFLG